MIKGLFSAALSLAIVFQGIEVPSHAHAAVPCAVAGGKTGTLKYSGQVSGTSAKICGATLLKKVTVVKKVVKAVVVVKPVTRVTVALAAAKKKAAAAKKKVAVVKVAAPKTAVAVKVTTTPKVTTTKLANQFTATPNRPSVIYSGSGSLSVGEQTSFSSSAASHTRSSYLLGYPAQVSFTPLSNSWNIGGVGATVTHVWNTPGVFKVTVTTTYSVKYRIVGKTGWVSLPGTISSTSAAVTITVGGDEVNPSVPSNVLLVHWNCMQKQSAIGC